MSRRASVARAPVASLAAAAAFIPLSFTRAFLYADRAHGRAAVASFLDAFDSVLDWTARWVRGVTLAFGVAVATFLAAFAAASLLAWAIATLH
ncbi:MAG: hypothetical protein M3346_00370 [Actinomycetota bacterium]|nr:hypothetical protein [Actinomycetota bacterium]